MKLPSVTPDMVTPDDGIVCRKIYIEFYIKKKKLFKLVK
jgi:hypothetical protein